MTSGLEQPSIIIAVLSVSGLILLGLGWRRIKQRRFLGAAGFGLPAFGMIAAGVVGSGLLYNLHSYKRLSHETQVATLVFVETGDRQFLGNLHLPNDTVSQYVMQGDEWQLDARVLKWHAKANLLGLDSRFRLQRLSTRYRDIEQERSAKRSAYELTENPGLDIWAFTKKQPEWLPWVDAVYGSATYLPMADRAAYSVWLSQSGLFARPINQQARDAISKW